MEQQHNNHLTLEDLAAMVKRGFDGMATKEDLNDLRMATKEDINELRMASAMLLEELNATHVEVSYIKRTVDMLTQSDTAQDTVIHDLDMRVNRVEHKMGLAQ